ncbi:hypothetical protein PMAYCL1PPCAC_05443, partial [Pristionchus mayeri]
QDEVDFCLQRSTGLWNRYDNFENTRPSRTRRQTARVIRDHRELHRSEGRSQALRKRFRARGAGTYDAGEAFAPPAPAPPAAAMYSGSAAAGDGGGGGGGSC